MVLPLSLVLTLLLPVLMTFSVPATAKDQPEVMNQRQRFEMVALVREEVANHGSLRGPSSPHMTVSDTPTLRSVKPPDHHHQQYHQRTRREIGKFSLSPTASPVVASQPPVVAVPTPITMTDHTTGTMEREPCGLLRQSIFCPTTFQGIIGRFLAKYLD
jgi:hypothetical protein